MRLVGAALGLVAAVIGFAGCSKAPAPIVQTSTSAPPAAVPEKPDKTAQPLPSAAAESVMPPAATTPVSWHRSGYRPPGIVDFHGHLSFSGLERIKRHMATNGIERIVNLSGGSGRRGGVAWKYATVLAQRLDGRIVNFMNVQWAGCCSKAWADREIASLRFVVGRLGYKGLKISKALGLGAQDEAGKLVAVDDMRLDPLWRAAAELRVPVSIHVADPRAFWQPLDEKNERYAELSVHPGWSYHGEQVPSWTAMLDAAERLFARHKDTTFVAVHFGNAAEDIERVDRMLTRLPNVHIDIAARVGEFGRHPAARVRKFFIKHQDRVLFGTDIGIADDYLMLGSNGKELPTDRDVQPFYDAHFRYLEGAAKQIAHPTPIQGPWKIDAVGLPGEVLDKLYRGNALRLLARVRVPAPAPAASAGPAQPSE